MTAPCRLLPTSDAQIACRTCGQTFSPDAVTLRALERSEGGSAPDQSSMMATLGLPCPRRADAAPTLHLGYGPTAAPRDGELLLALGEAGTTGGHASASGS